jgi:Protein of unknown function (DUF1571)
MFRCMRHAKARLASLIAVAIAGLSPCHAEEAESKTKAVDASPLASNLPSPDAPAALTAHPLSAVIDYARSEQRYLQQTVHDFTCRLVKRERIGGYLQDMHYIDMQVREEVVRDERLVQPLSIYLYFWAPRLVAGRKVIYVEGQNEGKMLVRNGGRHFDYVVASVDPNGDNAHEETLVPITQIGFNRLLGQMIDVLERHRAADPSGTNTKAERISGAKLNQRLCTVIRVTHPLEQPGLEFHVANVFVDNELHAPVRVDYSGWPKSPGGPAPLIAEYTYTELKLNVKLPAETFNRSRLRSRTD